MLAKIAVVNTKVLTFQEIKADFESFGRLWIVLAFKAN
jgi:hypothetical protein